MNSPLFLGLDFGTSGARAVLINADRQIKTQISVDFSNVQDPEIWRSALWQLLHQLLRPLRHQLRAIAINGTSSTVLICDPQGHPIAAPLLYNDVRGAAVLDQLWAIAPSHHTVLSATSSLAKLLWWMENLVLPSQEVYFLHQADWLSFWLHGQLGVSDYHNALKLGYDVAALCYPNWLQKLNLPLQLPRVLAPGTPITPVQPQIMAEFEIPSNCWVCAGTTDSLAAFLASEAELPGTAVTSLGSTLVLKLLSTQRIDDARYGIYSHRWGDLWLVGGASNTGGAVLRHFFSDAELAELSQQIDPDQASPWDYYPLLQPGERFPINAPTLPPRLDPRPDRPSEFLHGLLESLARIEAQGYRLLQNLGATPLTQVYTAGGGAKNLVWTKIRSRCLGVPVMRSPHTEAAYGTALLALHGMMEHAKD
jgi:xylulokinase